MKFDNKTVFRILIVLLIVLAFLVLYIFVLKPAYTGFVTDTRNEGIEYALVSVVQATAPPSCQQVPLNFGNFTVTLIAAECLQQPVSLVG